MRVQVAVGDAALVQVRCDRRDGRRQPGCGLQAKAQVRRVDVSGAGLQAGRPGQGRQVGAHQRHQQPRHLVRVVGYLPQQRDQVRVGASCHARLHFVERRAIAGHLALVQLERRLSARHLHAVNHPGGALAQHLAQLEGVPVDGVAPARRLRGRKALGQGVAGIRQPRQAGHRQQPLGQFAQPVGRHPQQFEPLAPRKAGRQGAQAVARQHQLLQLLAVAQCVGQLFKAILGQHQCPQVGAQCGGRQVRDAVVAQPDHFQAQALAYAGRHLGEPVVGAEQHLEPVQPAQVMGQAAQRIAAQVEHFEAVGQFEDLIRELREPAVQVEAGGTCQAAAPEVVEGVHEGAARAMKTAAMIPDLSTMAGAQLASILDIRPFNNNKVQGYRSMTYQHSYDRSIADPAAFWAEQADHLAWYRKPAQTLVANPDGTHQWFADGQLNSCYLALDHQIEQGRGEQTALIYDSPVTDTRQTFTFVQLRDEVARLAGLLRELGVKQGDGVIIYMPMVPQAAMAMLACARIGAVHSVVFGGFAANELALRIDDARPALLLTASCGLEFDRVIEYKPLVDKALQLATHQPRQVLVLQRPQARAELREGRDLDWQAAVAAASPVPPVALAAGDPLYIIYGYLLTVRSDRGPVNPGS